MQQQALTRFTGQDLFAEQFSRRLKIRFHTQLNNIKIPVSVTGGSKDMIKQSHLKHIADSIPNSTLTIFNGELHGSYVVNSTKIADFIIETVRK